MTHMQRCCVYFYPRSPCGERLQTVMEDNMILEISIHALLAESDSIQTLIQATGHLFLSTLSLRRATRSRPWGPGLSGISIHALLAESDGPKLRQLFGALISIHALLAESDPGAKSSTPDRYYFYPRSPCGERLMPVLSRRYSMMISIHALLAESDRRSVKLFRQNYISIHALLAESD